MCPESKCNDGSSLPVLSDFGRVSTPDEILFVSAAKLKSAETKSVQIVICGFNMLLTWNYMIRSES